MTAFTLERRWRETWWKIPWFFLLRRPYKHVVVYDGCEVTSVTYHKDGSVSMDFVARGGVRGSVTDSDLRVVRG